MCVGRGGGGISRRFANIRLALTNPCYTQISCFHTSLISFLYYRYACVSLEILFHLGLEQLVF